MRTKNGSPSGIDDIAIVSFPALQTAYCHPHAACVVNATPLKPGTGGTIWNGFSPFPLGSSPTYAMTMRDPISGKRGALIKSDVMAP